MNQIKRGKFRIKLLKGILVKVPEDQRLAIVYSDDPTKFMSEDTIKVLKRELLRHLDAYLAKLKAHQTPPIIFWSGHIKGVLRFDCLNLTAVKWVRDLLLKPSFNPDGIYAVVLAQCLFAKKAREPKPELRRVTVWIPGEDKVNFDVLMRRIQCLNPTLKATEWTNFGVYEKEGGFVVAFGVPVEHVKDLEAAECTAFGGLQISNAYVSFI